MYVIYVFVYLYLCISSCIGICIYIYIVRFWPLCPPLIIHLDIVKGQTDINHPTKVGGNWKLQRIPVAMSGIYFSVRWCSLKKCLLVQTLLRWPSES